ncbi:MAG TPA: DUF4193 family protein [Actinomycetota bacterium]|nr:DUF4193 family protein [Actinomycetota bacterium]
MSARDPELRTTDTEDDDDLEDLESPVDDADEPVLEDEAVVAAAPDEDDADDDASTSLEELLAQRASARRAADDADEDDDLLSLATEKDATVAEPLPIKVTPIKDRREFVCRRCHLVKARSQLADADRVLCRDCV